MKKRLISLCLVTAGLVLGALSAPIAWGTPGVAKLPERLNALIDHGGVALSRNGKVVFEHHPGQYTPASIIKLVTALVALQELGPEYRFKTEIFLDQDFNLWVKGYGNPFMVSEEWHALARELAAAGIFERPLANLLLDDSAQVTPESHEGMGESLNPYDAHLGALVSNFNTLNIKVGRDGSIESAEPQTPLIPLALELGQRLPPGRHRINVTAGSAGKNSLRYSGELARKIFMLHGALFTGEIRQEKKPGNLRPAFVYYPEKSLREILRAMLEFSNNFIANQIVMALALERYGEPATLEGGMRIVRSSLQERVGLNPRSFSLVEGSGLAVRNRIDLRGMLRVVDLFFPWRDLLSPYQSAHPAVLAKTGTLTGVSTLAGFLPAPPGERRPFVIMLEQKRRTRDLILAELLAAFP